MARRGFGASTEDIAGPLIGGGAAWAAALITRMMFEGREAAKWSGLIGALVGSGVSYGLGAAVPRLRGAVVPGMLSAAIVGLPRQLETLLISAGVLKDGYLGVITPEQFGSNGYYPGQDYSMLGESPVQLLDSGSGSTGMLGVHVPEQIGSYAYDDGTGMMGAGDVELLGGFGSNWAT